MIFLWHTFGQFLKWDLRVVYWRCKLWLLISRVWSMKGTVIRNILFVHENASEKCWCGWFIHLWIKYRGFTWLSWVRRANPAFRRPASPTKPKAFGLWTSWPFEVGVSWICLNYQCQKLVRMFLMKTALKRKFSVNQLVWERPRVDVSRLFLLKWRCCPQHFFDKTTEMTAKNSRSNPLWANSNAINRKPIRRIWLFLIYFFFRFLKALL